jgi:hypothetical protein
VILEKVGELVMGVMEERLIDYVELGILSMRRGERNGNELIRDLILGRGWIFLFFLSGA